MHGLEPLIPIALFLSIAGVVVLRGPIGRAEVLERQVEVLHHRVAELEERQDFAERMMARQDSARLPERN